MAFGARQEDGVWRLCLRKGRTIHGVAGADIRFASQVKAKACADALNERYWKPYDKHMRSTDPKTWPDCGYAMVELIRDMGGIDPKQYESLILK